MSTRRNELATTAYAILGMLAIRPMTPYDLAKRFDRSLGRLWPRARSKLMEGPKRLVELGLAEANPGSTGRRPKTVYSITPAGRAALRDWLARPGSGPALEFEQLLKVFFAEHGDTAAVRANLEAAQAWARHDMAEHVAVIRAFLDGAAPYPDRLPQLVLTGRFLSELALLVDRWSEWALEVVAGWPDDPAGAPPDLGALEALLADLESRRRPRGAGAGSGSE